VLQKQKEKLKEQDKQDIEDVIAVAVRHMYVATAVAAKGQFQGAVTKGCAQGRQTACVYRELFFLPSFLFFSP
jgi:hypothetical protein